MFCWNQIMIDCNGWFFSESIDKIQLLVEEKFQAVRNSDRSCSQFLGKPYASEHLQILVTISMIERLMHDIHFVVDPYNSSKKHVAYSNWFSTTSFPVLVLGLIYLCHSTLSFVPTMKKTF